MHEVEAKVRESFRNRKGGEIFINLERKRMFNKMLEADDTKGIYRDVSQPKAKSNSLFGS